MDFAAHGLLDGLQGEDRAQRERLLARLHDGGFSIAELTQAVRESRLALLPLDRILGGTYSAIEIEQHTGLPTATMIRLRGLQGLAEPGPDDRVFCDEDVEAARATKLLLDAGFAEERIVEMTMVMGEGMARLASTITAAFFETFLHKGDGEDEVALRFARLAERLTPTAAPILGAAYRAHLRDAVRRGILGPSELETGDLAGGVELAVCFADLVGFTRLAGQIDVHELGIVAGRLAHLSASLTAPPVRLIKTIGDAAMLVSPEPGALVAVALALVAAFEQEQLPSLRAGIAYGPATVRSGDYYGASVNLASRVTGVARPGTVLCTTEVRDAAPDAFHWSSAGRYRLKGIAGQTRLYRARPPVALGDGVEIDDEHERGVGGDL